MGGYRPRLVGTGQNGNDTITIEACLVKLINIARKAKQKKKRRPERIGAPCWENRLRVKQT